MKTRTFRITVSAAVETVAIEPMANLGKQEVFVASDGWTIRTRDGSRSAHFEHTVLVMDNDVEILTKLSD